MNILCIMHADFETPGVIQDWALEKNYFFKVEKPYKGEILSSIDDYDLLIIMGGPQSPLNIDQAPYLRDEITLILSAIQQNKRILGFCLGAQLIGEALGAKTTRSPEKEVGVYPVTFTDKGLNDPLFASFENSFNVIHWHNDMPGLTDSAEVLAYSEGCPRQIVKYGQKIYGFQCHLEITKDGIKEMISAVSEDLNPSKFTQSEDQLLNNDYTSINNNMIKILNKFIDL
jgi:GMP synthase (glutamine-hydrolysing)